MRKFLFAAALSAAAGLGSAPALAHHSFAMFDTSKQVDIVGTVKDFQYTNPHSWLMIVAPAPDGKAVVEWGFESEGPSILLRNGIKKSSLNPGDKITVHAFPMRDGRPAGALISVTKADGSTIQFRNGAPPKGVTLQAN